VKILQISNKAPLPANDGSSIAICTLAQGLADSGAELHLLTVNTKKHFKPDDLVPPAFKQQMHYRSVYRNTDTSALGALLNLFSTQSYFVSRFHFSEFADVLAKKLQAVDFDIVQIEGVFMAPYIPLIRRHSKARIVLRPHNVEHLIWERHLQQEKNGLKKWYLSLQNKRLKSFELKAFAQVDAIVPITDIDKELIAGLTPVKRLHTCLTGVDLNAYRMEPASEPDTCFHFASMDWLPNREAVDWLMREVWPLVQQQNNNLGLVLAGRDMPEQYKRLQSGQVNVMEHVASSEKFYHNYGIMLVPLWSGSGLRIKLVEGLAYGKAIVSTSIGAEGVPYENGKHLLIADDAQSFADAMLKLAADAELRNRLQQNARALAESYFDYKSQAAALLRFYETL